MRRSTCSEVCKTFSHPQTEPTEQSLDAKQVFCRLEPDVAWVSTHRRNLTKRRPAVTSKAIIFRMQSYNRRLLAPIGDLKNDINATNFALSNQTQN